VLVNPEVGALLRAKITVKNVIIICTKKSSGKTHKDKFPVVYISVIRNFYKEFLS